MLNFTYDRLIPQRYQKAAGVADYVWEINERWHHPYSYIRHPKGGAFRIVPSVYCQILSDGRFVDVLIPITRHPQLAESLLLFGQALFTGNRVERYLTLHKSFESLKVRSGYDFTAVRHGLAHASTALSRPGTVEALVRLFGTTNIDFRIPAHVKQMYLQCGEMLRVLDKEQGERVRSVLKDALILGSKDDALLDWQVHGIQGWNDPLRIHQEWN